MLGKKCGGTSEVHPATAEIQALCDQVKAAAEEKAGRSFAKYVAKSYCSQVVAGTNYFVKIEVDDDECIHVRIYRKLPCHGEDVSLAAIQVSKTHGDALGYF